MYIGHGTASAYLAWTIILQHAHVYRNRGTTGLTRDEMGVYSIARSGAERLELMDSEGIVQRWEKCVACLHGVYQVGSWESGYQSVEI